MKHDGVLISQRADELWHSVVVCGRRDVHAAKNVASDVVVAADIDDGDAGGLRSDESGQLLAGDAREIGDGGGGHVCGWT